MSVQRAQVISCDGCGEEETFTDTDEVSATKTNARAYFKSRGWKTGLKATPQRDSKYDVKVDLCPDCVYWDEVDKVNKKHRR